MILLCEFQNISGLELDSTEGIGRIGSGLHT